MKNKFSNLIFLYLISQILSNNQNDQLSPKYLIIPFKVSSLDNNSYLETNITKYIQDLYDKKIYSNITIGTPNQNIEMQFTLSRHPISTEEKSCIFNTSYNYKKSSSFKNISYVQYIVGTNTSKVQDKFYIYKDIFFKEKIEINDVNFLYSIDYLIKNKDGRLCFLTGLELVTENQKSIFYEFRPFIEQLYNKKYISENIWSIYYINETDGLMLLGAYPHEIKKLYQNQSDYNEILNLFKNLNENEFRHLYNKISGGLLLFIGNLNLIIFFILIIKNKLILTNMII